MVLYNFINDQKSYANCIILAIIAFFEQLRTI